jgi:hypothetical protein
MGHPSLVPIFDRSVLPIPPSKMAAGRIVFGKAYHDYDNWYRADMLTLFVKRSVARELGLFLLSCAFHARVRDIGTAADFAHPTPDL